MPTLLMVTGEGINAKEAATSQIDNLFVPFAGVFTGKPAEGLQMTPLSFVLAQFANGRLALATAGPTILRDFKPSNEAHPIALRLTGKFKTAYPKNDGLKESVAPGEVDSRRRYRYVERQGRRARSGSDGSQNGSTGKRQLEPRAKSRRTMSGDDDLITSRNRASMNRPFTRVKDMEAKAGRVWEEKMRTSKPKSARWKRRSKNCRRKQ